MSQNRKGSATNEALSQNKILSNPTSALYRINLMLDQLDNIKPYGEGYRANCPTGHRSKGSLSIKQCEDGRILIHCFSGCSTQVVLDAIGLEMTDLMPERLTHTATPEQRRKWKQDALHRDWCELSHEVLLDMHVGYIAYQQALNGEPLNKEEADRLKQAIADIYRIGRLFDGQS